MLLARLKPEYKFHRAVLFSGHEFVKTEWREVPAEHEVSARRDERIEVKQARRSAAEEAELDAIETSADEEKAARRSRSRPRRNDEQSETEPEEA